MIQQKRMTPTVLTQDFLNLLSILWAPHHWAEHVCVRVHTDLSVYVYSYSDAPSHNQACTIKYGIHNMIQKGVIRLMKCL